MNLLKKNIKKLVLASYVLMAPVSVVYAQSGQIISGDPCPAGTICNPISQNTISGFIKTLLEGVLRAGIPVVALAIIYCGFLFVEARGNSEKLTKAREALLYTLIGAAILLGSWAIAELIQSTVKSL